MEKSLSKYCITGIVLSVLGLGVMLEETVIANTVAAVVCGSVVVYLICHWIYSKKY